MPKEVLIRHLEDEQKQLEKKICKLELFLKSKDILGLSDLHKQLLFNQFNAMCNYNNTLCFRLRLLIDESEVGNNGSVKKE